MGGTTIDAGHLLFFAEFLQPLIESTSNGLALVLTAREGGNAGTHIDVDSALLELSPMPPLKSLESFVRDLAELATIGSETLANNDL